MTLPAIEGLDPARAHQAITAGLRWVYHTPQPVTALLQHHGIRLWTDPGSNRNVGLVPAGYRAMPVLVIEVGNVDRDPDGIPRNTLDVDELVWWSQIVDDAGQPFRARVADAWNWYDGNTTPTPAHPNTVTNASISLSRTADPSLLDAVGRYQAGCPTHPTVPGVRGNGVFCECGWFQRGYTQLVPPRMPDGFLP